MISHLIAVYRANSVMAMSINLKKKFDKHATTGIPMSATNKIYYFSKALVAAFILDYAGQITDRCNSQKVVIIIIAL